MEADRVGRKTLRSGVEEVRLSVKMGALLGRRRGLLDSERTGPYFHPSLHAILASEFHAKLSATRSVRLPFTLNYARRQNPLRPRSKNRRTLPRARMPLCGSLIPTIPNRFDFVVEANARWITGLGGGLWLQGRGANRTGERPTWRLLEVTKEMGASPLFPIWRIPGVDPGARTQHAEKRMLSGIDHNPGMSAPDRQIAGLGICYSAEFVNPRVEVGRGSVVIGEASALIEGVDQVRAIWRVMAGISATRTIADPSCRVMAHGPVVLCRLSCPSAPGTNHQAEQKPITPRLCSENHMICLYRSFVEEAYITGVLALSGKDV